MQNLSTISFSSVLVSLFFFTLGCGAYFLAPMGVVTSVISCWVTGRLLRDFYWIKREFGMLKNSCVFMFWKICGALFTIHGAHSWKQETQIIFEETMRLATYSFWIWCFSSTISCKKISLLLPHQCPQLLPHQYPKFVLKLLNFTFITNCPNLSVGSDTQKLINTPSDTNSLEQPLSLWFSWLRESIYHKTDAATVRERCQY